MNILGVSCYHHDSAAANIKNNIILGASHEERFSRNKYDNNFPIHTIDWLKNAYDDFDHAVFYEETTYKRFKRDIKKVTKAKPVLVDHHEAHAMSSIITTDWQECAVMVIDTVGNKFSTSLGVYSNGRFTWLKRMRYPNSLGLFYSAATRFLGLQPLSDESQVMAAAAYGTPKWSKYIRDNILHYDYEANYTVLQNLERGAGYGVLDWDIAASVQTVTQTIIGNMASWLQQETGMTKLAYAGGVALNCVANTDILKWTKFDDIAIQPAAGDAGCALGAAALLERPIHFTPYLGVNATRQLTSQQYADAILQGKIVAVIEGQAEFGPRALGNRSLLCLPTDDNIKKLNKIKNRAEDSWRPYAPICQKETADKWFHVTKACPYMLHIAKIKSGPFTTYDNSARLQVVSQDSNIFLWRILELLRYSGHSVLINTSLNAKGKPIVNTVDDLKEIQLHNELCY